MISWEQIQSLYEYKGDGVKRLKKIIFMLRYGLQFVGFLSFQHKNDIQCET